MSEPIRLSYQDCVALRECVSTEESRPVLNSVHVGGKYVEATNGHIMARIPVETNGLDVLVRADAFKLVKSGQSLEISRDGVRVLDKLFRPVVDVADPFREGTYPNAEQIWNGRVEPTHRFAVSGHYLAKLAKMADKRTGRVEFALAINDKGEAHTAITVSFAPSVNAEAILMPLRILDS